MRRDLIKIYNYIYVVAKAQGVFGDADHRELINKYSQEGWKFITAIGGSDRVATVYCKVIGIY